MADKEILERLATITKLEKDLAAAANKLQSANFSRSASKQRKWLTAWTLLNHDLGVARRALADLASEGTK